MTTISVEIGQWVDQSTQIGTVGAVGFTFPCPYYHLHYEVDQVGTGPIEFGPLRACHGSSLVTYPSALGYAAWDDVPPFSLGVWSDGSACVKSTPPGAPQNVIAKPGDRRATVSFTPPASDGGDSVSSYAVTASPGGQRAQGRRSPIVVRHLTNGRRYRFTVVAANASGPGDPSVPSNAVVPRKRR
jgi:Fibronectin type III domain